MTKQISDQVLSEIETLFNIARTNGAHVSIRDIANLTSAGLTEAELRDAWTSNPFLTNTYKISQDIVLESGKGVNELPSEVLAQESKKRKRAEEYLEFARQFAAWCRSRKSRLLSVSGSVSYRSTGSADDLDFFIVSKKDSLWLLLARTLILARVFRYLHPGSPRICFSYAIDEEYAAREFCSPRDPLSARDALTTLVVQGPDFYTKLLIKNHWISSFYPKLYKQKTLNSPSETSFPTSSSASSRFLNLLVYFVVGKYVNLKSELLNRQFQRQRKYRSIFEVRMAKDHLVFESNHYTRLRKIYRKLSRRIAFEDSPLLGWE
ncbi:MAG TPA: hypothetical protein VFE96_06650 [Candidatus Bathyarchaeia archaeon]|nr:hypothetical protein [Candidatus Bathyarchaeia archaeon]